MPRPSRTLHATTSLDPRSPLPQSFYRRSAERVATELLGCVLVHRVGRTLLAGRIVETEAYGGENDQASHARAGETARNAVMYGPPGHAYVYFIYGMYDMMNIVCLPQGMAAAVLVRALEPIAGVDAMRRRRSVTRDRDLASGPGKLCRALGITRALNGVDLRGGRLWIAPGTPHASERMQRGPRIGVEYAGSDADRLWRFWLSDNPHVSRARR